MAYPIHKFILLFATFLVTNSFVDAQYVTTIAGNRSANFATGEPGVGALRYPDDLTIDDNGNLYVADYYLNQIRKVAPDGTITVLAGKGYAEFVDGVGEDASFSNPTCVQFYNDVIYVCDYGNSAVRKVTLDGNVTTIAGNGTSGDEDGDADGAVFGAPTDLVIDENGIIYVIDSSLGKLKAIYPNSTVATISGKGIYGYADGDVDTSMFDWPCGISFDSNGDFLVSDTGNNVIRRVYINGTTTTIAGNGTAGSANGDAAEATFAAPRGAIELNDGTILIADYGNGKIRKFLSNETVIDFVGNGKMASIDGTGTNSSIIFPEDIIISGNGTIFIAESGSGRIRTLTEDGELGTYAGILNEPYQDGVGNKATFSKPYDITVDTNGNIYVLEAALGVIRKINTSRNVTTFYGKDSSLENAFSFVVDFEDNIFVVLENGTIIKIDSDGNKSTFVDQVGGPDSCLSDIYIAPNGTSFIVDYCINQVYKMSREGEISVLASNGEDVYYNGTEVTIDFIKLNTMGIDFYGNVFIFDLGAKTVYKISTSGVVDTIESDINVSELEYFGRGAVDTAENIYFSDFLNHRIKKIHIATGTAYAFVGGDRAGDVDGYGNDARFASPYSITFGPDGNLYVCDLLNYNIRKVFLCQTGYQFSDEIKECVASTPTPTPTLNPDPNPSESGNNGSLDPSNSPGASIDCEGSNCTNSATDATRTMAKLLITFGIVVFATLSI